jgi:hypothetical protein
MKDQGKVRVCEIGEGGGPLRASDAAGAFLLVRIEGEALLAEA